MQYTAAGYLVVHHPPIRMRAAGLLLTAALSLAAANHAAAAQATAARDDEALGQITATGTAELRVPPTKVSFSIGVISDAASSAQASMDNARTYQAFLA